MSYGQQSAVVRKPIRGGDASANSFYRAVMGWLLVAFALAFVGTYFIGPLIPQSLMMPLYGVMLVGMLASSFLKRTAKGSAFFTILYSTGLGIILYPTLNFYIESGSGDIVLLSLAGTVIIFASAAIMGWNSKVNINSWYPKLFAIVLGVIGINLLNIFFFRIEILQMLIAAVVLVVFTIYAFMDIQNLRNRTWDMPASWYALNVFLDIYNIFIALLQLFGGSARR